MKIAKDALLSALPAEWPEDLLPGIRASIEGSGVKIIVVDDDPTGTQTVYDVPVFTEWSPKALGKALVAPGPISCVLVNSRSMPIPQARAINYEVAANLRVAREATGRDFVLISRSDSTLRGHYPGEVQALIEGLGEDIDATVFIPFFLEGGRMTIEDVHYVTEGEFLTPAAETEFARDPAFTYRNSNLPLWVSEKHAGLVAPQDVMSITLTDLRNGGPELVLARLKEIRGGQTCIVNAASYRDLEVFVAGLLEAEAAGKRFIYRTAASFVRARGGLAPRGLLTHADLAGSVGKGGGLIVAGSFVQKSTAQIEVVRFQTGIFNIEVSVEKVLDGRQRESEIRRVADLANESLASNKDTLVYTSRKLVTGDNPDASLQIGENISTALVEIVSQLSVRPAWMIAKGGMTSSDIATKALNVRRALALGQSVPGVPIWRTESESRWPGLIYVVFPGNVGEPEAIVGMVEVLRGT
jgi:uncharacterized protein YgbK (DUF1537 family)